MADKEKTIKQKNGDLVSKDEIIKRINLALACKERALAEIVSQKDLVISEKDRVISEKDERITAQAAQLVAQAELLASVDAKAASEQGASAAAAEESRQGDVEDHDPGSDSDHHGWVGF